MPDRRGGVRGAVLRRVSTPTCWCAGMRGAFLLILSLMFEAGGCLGQCRWVTITTLLKGRAFLKKLVFMSLGQR